MSFFKARPLEPFGEYILNTFFFPVIQQEVHPNRTMPLPHKSLRRSGNFPCDSVKSFKSHRRIYLLLAYFTILGGKLVSRDMVVNENGPKANVLNSVLLAEAFSDDVSLGS